MRLIPVLAVALFLFPQASKAETVAQPGEVITAFHDQLLGVMKQAKALGIQGRYNQLAPAIDGAFHLTVMIRQATGGKAWRAAQQPQRRDLTDAFRHWTVSTYASRFKGYSGQIFTTKAVKPGPQKDSALVETELTTPDKGKVNLTYLMVKFNDRWGIYDVLTKRGITISELAQRTSEYRKIVRDGGVPLLISTLRQKATAILVPQPVYKAAPAGNNDNDLYSYDNEN